MTEDEMLAVVHKAMGGREVASIADGLNEIVTTYTDGTTRTTHVAPSAPPTHE